MTDEAAVPTPPKVVVANPLTWLVDFIGSANVQKTLGGLQVATAGLTGAEGQTFAMKLAGMSVGAAYGLAVHYFDYLRAKLGR